MQPHLNLGNFQLSATDLSVQGNPPLDEWAGPLQFALWAQKASPWWIGDILNAGDARFGEEFSQVCGDVVSPDMLHRYEGVARRVPSINRLPGLSWSAHAQVAKLPPEEQQSVLLEAQKNGWSSTAIREQIKRSRPPK